MISKGGSCYVVTLGDEWRRRRRRRVGGLGITYAMDEGPMQEVLEWVDMKHYSIRLSSLAIHDG
jgi:hypothetical protein